MTTKPKRPKGILITQEMFDATVAAGTCEEEREKARAFIGKRSRNPGWAYYYARNVLKSPWPEGEDVIKTDPRWAYYYAYYVLKLDREAAIEWYNIP